MQPKQHIYYSLLAVMIGLASGCGTWSSAKARKTEPPPAAPIASDREMSEGAIRFLEERVKKDPDDFIAHNKLGGYYLQRLRETGNLDYLRLAQRTAQASLKAIPAEQNAAGLSLLAETEFAAHDFTAARTHAEQLIKIEPGKGFPYRQLGDALLELGDDDGAARAFREMERRDPASYSTLLRLARLESLRGQTARARETYTRALALAVETVPPSRENVAWCHWQLGEIEFNSGHYDAAERHYQDSLTTFPDYFRGLAGLGRVRAAVGDLTGAIGYFEKAVRIVPEPTFVAMLGDLYDLAGRQREAEAQFELVEQIARLGTAGGSVYNRQLGLFYADHDLKREEAYGLAKREYEVRRDIYGADALAWTALKAGRLAEAQAAITDALRLGTEDARLYYHSGMIALAAGNKTKAQADIDRALKLNPQFDPRQSAIARQALTK
jgi:tetratricopeptide (TPR) repeat protein